MLCPICRSEDTQVKIRALQRMAPLFAGADNVQSVKRALPLLSGYSCAKFLFLNGMAEKCRSAERS